MGQNIYKRIDCLYKRIRKIAKRKGVLSTSGFSIDKCYDISTDFNIPIEFIINGVVRDDNKNENIGFSIHKTFSELVLFTSKYNRVDSEYFSIKFFLGIPHLCFIADQYKNDFSIIEDFLFRCEKGLDELEEILIEKEKEERKQKEKEKAEKKLQKEREKEYKRLQREKEYKMFVVAKQMEKYFKER